MMGEWGTPSTSSRRRNCSLSDAGSRRASDSADAAGRPASHPRPTTAWARRCGGSAEFGRAWTTGSGRTPATSLSTGTREAAIVALDISVCQLSNLDNPVAAQGWIARARRSVEAAARIGSTAGCG